MNDDWPQALGRAIRAARLEAGMSQADVDIACGVPKARVSRYENGHVEPSVSTLIRIGQGIGVSASELLARTGR